MKTTTKRGIMIRLEMSIPTIPGKSKKPPSKRPGLRNIERREEEERKNRPAIGNSPNKPQEKPITKTPPTQETPNSGTSGTHPSKP